MTECEYCGEEIGYKVVKIEWPPMRSHTDDEPMYSDGRGRWWYEGEEPRYIDLCARCTAPINETY
jgi:hypothetical protein